ncbi:MAG: hypothetical protein KBD76_15320 [Bacteriovorax sp.]|nr:hypothetical protein [Bacteriovorax sp.]
MKHILLILVLGHIAVIPSLTFAADCMKQAEEAAINSEKKDKNKEKFQAKNTLKVIDLSILKANGVKKDEESISTEIYDSKGSFVPYDILLKKESCKIVTVKSTTL